MIRLLTTFLQIVATATRVDAAEHRHLRLTKPNRRQPTKIKNKNSLTITPETQQHAGNAAAQKNPHPPTLKPQKSVTMLALLLVTALTRVASSAAETFKYRSCVTAGHEIAIARVTPADDNHVSLDNGESSTERAAQFEKVFRGHIWGKESPADEEDGVLRRSGPGSTVANAQQATAAFIAAAKIAYRAQNGAKPFITIVDCPCGDMTWMNITLHELNHQGVPFAYFGFDIVPSIVEQNRRLFAHQRSWRFGQLDLVVEPPSIPSHARGIDLLLMRQMTQHLYTRDANSALRNVKKSGAALLLATTFPEQPVNIELVATIYRYRRQNLELPPFSLPAPICVHHDCCDDAATYLALWNMSSWMPA